MQVNVPLHLVSVPGCMYGLKALVKLAGRAANTFWRLLVMVSERATPKLAPPPVGSVTRIAVCMVVALPDDMLCTSRL